MTSIGEKIALTKRRKGDLIKCLRCGKFKSRPEFYRRTVKHSVSVTSECKKCFGEYSKKYRESHKIERANYNHQRLLKLRRLVYSHYSPNPVIIKCACCGEDNLKFMTIDHKNGGGSKERSGVGYGSTFLNWLVKNGFPPGYQILCFNCNSGRSANGGVCPHKEKDGN